MQNRWDQYKVKSESESQMESDTAPEKIDWEQYRTPNKIDPNILKRIPGAAANAASDAWETAKNIPGAVIQGIGNIPKDIDYLKENVPAAGSMILNNPKLAGKEGLAGLGEMAAGLANKPAELMHYLGKIGFLTPKVAAMPPLFTPEQIANIKTQLVGEGQEQPGGELIRGIGRNVGNIAAAGKVASLINPMQLTSKGIAKNVLNKEVIQKGLHSKAYDQIWAKADKTGFNKVPVDPAKIDIETIKKYTPEKYYGATEKFLENPTLQNAQKAQSDLGKLEREISKGTTLTSETKATLEAAKNAKEHIKNSMFKNAQGEMNNSLKKEYDKVTKSYEGNVIPYTTNKAIQDYKRGDLTAKEMVQKISSGKFRARKGSAHPQLRMKESAGSLLKYGGVVGGIGTSMTAANWLLNKMLSKNKENF